MTKCGVGLREETSSFVTGGTPPRVVSDLELLTQVGVSPVGDRRRRRVQD